MEDDVAQLHSRLNKEITTFNLFVQVTQKTLELMQQSDTLMADNMKRLTSASDDFIDQIALQQRQIGKLLQIVQTLCRHIQLSLPELSELEQETERSSTVKCPPANDETGNYVQSPDGRDSDVVAD